MVRLIELSIINILTREFIMADSREIIELRIECSNLKLEVNRLLTKIENLTFTNSRLENENEALRLIESDYLKSR